MKYAIISDVHANDAALKNVINDAVAYGAEKIVCLGDTVGYGPAPAAAIRLVRARAAAVIAGNHDDAVSGRRDAKDFVDLAGDAVQRHREALSSADLAWLKALPYVCRLEGAVAVHGDMTAPEEFRYIETEEQAKANFDACPDQLVFIGHTHVPGIFLTGESGKVYKLESQDFTLEEGKRYIVNPGSVGYPRENNGECKSTYVLYDSTEQTVEFRELPFSVASVMQRGKTPKRPRKRAIFTVLALVALLAAAGAGAAVWFLRPKEEILVTMDENPALVMDTRSILLAEGHRIVRANLKLEESPWKVLLKITYRDDEGTELGVEKLSVKTSACQPRKVPEKTAEVEFAVYRMRGTDIPVILSFEPTSAK